MVKEKNWSDTLIRYYTELQPPPLPPGIGYMHPYRQPQVIQIVHTYFKRYYNDDRPRTLLFGINPGRFGAGVTGISFTDPVILREKLGIEHDLEPRAELSAAFIHEMIDAFGGIDLFTRHFFISSLYPLGFLEQGRNINYYDIPDWKRFLHEAIATELRTHAGWNINREVAVCIGKGQNQKVLETFNKELKLFRRIETLPHPRWVMQYRTRSKQEFIREYVSTLHRLLDHR